MQMKQCPNGHFFDQSKSRECPYCTSESANINAVNPVFTSDTPMGATIPLVSPGDFNVNRNMPSEVDKTRALIKKDIGIDPVVGWLVCIEGKEKGKDYRMHADNNFIGRSNNMDICIGGDDTISRENHAIITYDPKEQIYYFSASEGRSIVRINGKASFNTVELAPFDKIEMGQSKFLFVPLCGGEFNWID